MLLEYISSKYQIVLQNNYYAVPQKFITKAFVCDNLLDIIETELDKRYYGIEISFSTIKLTRDEFINYKLKEMKKGYKFLIFIGEGELIDGIPTIIKTRFKNRIHRSIYLEMQYRNGSGVITNCHYYDRIYKEVPDIAPEYPEIMVYGWTLPAKGIYFRHIDGLLLDNVTVESYMPDVREDFVFDDVVGVH